MLDRVPNDLCEIFDSDWRTARSNAAGFPIEIEPTLVRRASGMLPDVEVENKRFSTEKFFRSSRVDENK